MEKYDCDGLFIHPVIGPKKVGDFTGDIILKSYNQLIEKNYPINKIIIGAFNNYSRYAGPKEAVFTALCRKNFGCSHIIVGRDHTGVGSFYPKDGAKRFFEELGDIGIQPIFFDEVYYCLKCKKHVEKCKHGINYNYKINGTEIRAKLEKGKALPDWFIRESVLNLISDEIKYGHNVFIK
jgi:ATP sulfurylase